MVMIADRSGVKVIHGANDGVFALAGATVASTQASLSDAFNIPLEAFARINGKIVGEDHRVLTNDLVEFVMPWGTKGGSAMTPPAPVPPLKTPFPYTGGKSRVAPEVWRRFGDVKNYVEPFFGGGGVLLNRPVWGGNRIETVNDLDSLLVNFWRAVKFHPRKLATAANYPVSALDLHARHNWLVRRRTEITEQIRSQEAWCDPRVAAWWVWGISQWIGGGWCAGPHRLHRQRPGVEGRGVHRRDGGSRGEALRRLYASLAARLERANILSGDWSGAVTPAMTTRYGTTGVFLDPPYTNESGRKDGLYASDDLTIGHKVRDWAVAHGDDRKFRIALCGYEGEYRMPPNWSVYGWKGGGSKNGHKERIWFSPHCLA
jgi:DNA adenine methylase